MGIYVFYHDKTCKLISSFLEVLGTGGCDVSIHGHENSKMSLLKKYHCVKCGMEKNNCHQFKFKGDFLLIAEHLNPQKVRWQNIWRSIRHLAPANSTTVNFNVRKTSSTEIPRHRNEVKFIEM